MTAPWEKPHGEGSVARCGMGGRLSTVEPCRAQSAVGCQLVVMLKGAEKRCQLFI